MTEQEHKNLERRVKDNKYLTRYETDYIVDALEEVQQYRVIGTPEEIKQKLAELERWHTTEVNPKINNVFANTSTLICHNCDHKDEYIEVLEAEIEEYRHSRGMSDCGGEAERNQKQCC